MGKLTRKACRRKGGKWKDNKCSFKELKRIAFFPPTEPGEGLRWEVGTTTPSPDERYFGNAKDMIEYLYKRGLSQGEVYDALHRAGWKEEYQEHLKEETIE